MMKAAVVTSHTKPLEIKQVPIPKVGPNDILVKNIACGVCHSDLHLAKGDWDFPITLPRIVGHEGIGEVVELGSNVGDNVKKGDTVGIPWINKTCLHCEYCLSGREPLCSKQIDSGFTIDGCYAEYTILDGNFAAKLPEGMDPYTSAPLFCAGVTVYKALKVCQARPGQWVSIIGVGGLGSLAVNYAKIMGFRVLAVVAPNDKTAVKLAKDMGAEEVYDGPSDKNGEWIQTKTMGGVQAVLVTVPLISAYEEAFKSVKPGGCVVAIALPNRNDKLSLSIVDFTLKGITFLSSLVGTRQDLQETLELAKLHNITCKVQKRKLEEINEIFDDMTNYKISGRVVLDFSSK